MSKAELIASLESKLRPAVTSILPPSLAVRIYSKGRQKFLELLKGELPEPYIPPKNLERKLWGITFRSPVMNAAGMFKNGECYDMVARQGAGAYLAGTVTPNRRIGNKGLPFVPYPNSGAASNYLGLPNEGAEAAAKRLDMMRVNNCPIGVSVMDAPHLEGYSTTGLALAVMLCKDAGVDFIEINESCPNTGHAASDDEVYRRLQFLSEAPYSSKKIPLIVKFSTDTPLQQVPQIMDMLFKLGYSGVNFGNTSAKHDDLASSISVDDLKLYFHFTQKFKGGISGRPLKDRSLKLVEAASRYLRQGPPSKEFHVWRTGGVEDAKDIRESEQAGASMSQMFTGYWDAFARDGHGLFKQIYEGLYP